jgi:hypothetical protein
VATFTFAIGPDTYLCADPDADLNYDCAVQAG